MMQSAGAAYMEITGGSADEELIAATVPASIAGTVELHETSMATDEGDMDMGSDMDMGGDMDMGSDMDMGGDMDMDTDTTMGGGMMTMKQVASILIPAGETVTLEPGGLHIMLLDLAAPLVPGETFEMTLEFASGAKVTVPVEVRTTS